MTPELDRNDNQYARAMKEIEDSQESFWNSLTKEQQLACFCSVSRRIHRGEIVDRGTYRYVLYQIFGFGPEAYGAGMDCGYMAIHNSIFTPECERDLLVSFAKKLGVADPEDTVTNFYKTIY